MTDLINIKNKAILAIDCSYSLGMLVAIDQNGIIIEHALDIKMQHASAIADGIKHIISTLEDKDIHLASVMVGLGPGSFIGIRIALATAMGFCFGRSLPLMGFCSHRALGYSLLDSSDDRSRLVLTKASGPWCYYSAFENVAGRLCPISEPRELTQQEAFLELPENSLLIGDILFDPQVLSEKLLEQRLLQGPSSQGIEKAIRDKIANKWFFEDESEIIRPNYVRAPSVHGAQNY